CLGDNVIECNEEGEIEIIETCDPLMGFACEEAACTGLCELNELESTNKGCDFYPTVTANILGSEGFHFTVRIANNGLYPANIEFFQGENSLLDGVVPEKSVETFTLPWVPELQATQDWSASRVVADGAYRLHTDQPVMVYQYNAEGGGEGADSAESNDASILLPIHVLEADYTVVSTHSWPDPNSNVLLPGFYTVTAIEDGTVVTLDTPGSVAAHPGAGVNLDGTGVVTLGAGDVLEVFSAGSANDPGDLSGTRIHATNPVQVIGGHMCTGVPTQGDNTCNHLEETILPEIWLGNQYFVVPPATGGQVDNPREQEVYIVATEDGTHVEVKPDVGVWPNVNAGEKIVVPLTDESMLVESSKPVSVSQVMASPELGERGGPSMLHIPPVVNWSEQDVFVLPEGYDDVYINILIDSEDPMVNLTGPNNAQIDSGFNSLQVPGTNFWHLRYKLDASDVGAILRLVSWSPMSISVYGESIRGSAWYPAGLQLTSGGNGGLPKAGSLK
ncbi:MAG: IgGFc-binding protein, partial [Nannocystaceae bacterium]